MWSHDTILGERPSANAGFRVLRAVDRNGR